VEFIRLIEPGCRNDAALRPKGLPIDRLTLNGDGSITRRWVAQFPAVASI
jgi:hypothetical protein